MRSSIVVLTAALLCLGATQANAAWTITQLTDNSTDDGIPVISGSNVAWVHWDGSDWEIYSNFAGQLSDNSLWDRKPAISGTNVVWQTHVASDRVDISTNFAGTFGPGYYTDPDISGTNVVWKDSTTGIAEIGSNYAGHLTNNTIEEDEPAISGTNVAWSAGPGGDPEIHTNFAGQLTNNIYSDVEPDISGTNVVWQGFDGSDWEIYSNFAGQLTDNDSWDDNPAISEGVLKALCRGSMGQSSAHQVDHSDQDHRFAILR